MTKKQRNECELAAKMIDHVCQEVFDGYAVVGYIAGSTDRPMLIVHAESCEMVRALNILLGSIDVRCSHQE